MSERFVITKNKGEICVLDTGHDLVEEEGNALLFSVDLEDNDVVVDYLAYELEPMVRLLNEQAKELEKLGITLP